MGAGRPSTQNCTEKLKQSKPTLSKNQTLCSIGRWNECPPRFKVSFLGCTSTGVLEIVMITGRSGRPAILVTFTGRIPEFPANNLLSRVPWRSPAYWECIRRPDLTGYLDHAVGLHIHGHIPMNLMSTGLLYLHRIGCELYDGSFDDKT